jgi:hypothetical protein
LTTHSKCDAVLIDLKGDGSMQIILLLATGLATVFHSGDDHRWSYLGSLGPALCGATRDALLGGTFEIAEPAFKEISVSGRRLRLSIPEVCSPLLSRP